MFRHLITRGNFLYSLYYNIDTYVNGQWAIHILFMVNVRRV